MSTFVAGLSASTDSFGVSSLKRRLQDVEMLEPAKKSKRSTEVDANEDAQTESGHSEESSVAASTMAGSISTPATPASQSKNWRPYVYHCPRDDCDRAFNRPCRLAEHMRSHTDERPYKCRHTGCDKTFRRDTHLSRHVKTAHSDERNHPCPWPGCDKRFANGTRMRRHYDTHESREQFRCTSYPPCNETFRKHKTLQSHIAAVHLNEKPWPCTHVDQVNGVQCTRAYNTESKLRSHEAKAHNGELRFVCTLCAVQGLDADGEDAAPRFATHAALKEHIQAEHPPKCEECNIVFESQGKLASHIDQLHSDLSARTQFRCEEPGCGKSFAKRNNLKEHVRVIHRGEKRFVCGVTNVTGSSKFEEEGEDGVTVRHEWDGQGCHKSFGTKATLEEHIRTQHIGLEGSVRAKKRRELLAEGRDPDAAAKLGRRAGGVSGKGSRPRKTASAGEATGSFGQAPVARFVQDMPVGKFYLGGLGEEEEQDYGYDDEMLTDQMEPGDVHVSNLGGFMVDGYEQAWKSPNEVPVDPVLQFLDFEA